MSANQTLLDLSIASIFTVKCFPAYHFNSSTDLVAIRCNVIPSREVIVALGNVLRARVDCRNIADPEPTYYCGYVDMFQCVGSCLFDRCNDV